MSRKAWVIVIGVCVVALILRVSFFFVSVLHVPASADESIISLQAKQIVVLDASSEVVSSKLPNAPFGRFPLLFMAQPYMFPIESYITAPFIRLLPENAFGVRFIPILLGLISLFFSFLIFKRWGGLRDVWPGLILLLFPSAYLFTLQTAFALPGYPSYLLLLPVVIFLGQKHKEERVRPWAYALACGFFAGLTCSGTLLALPLVMLAAGMVCFAKAGKRMLVSCFSFIGGLLVGLFPYFLAKSMYPGAYQAVSNLYSFKEAMSRLWSPTLSYTLPTAMGIKAPVFPDTRETVGLINGLNIPFAVLWILLLLTITAICVYRFYRRTVQDRRPYLKVIDVFAGLSLLCVALFVLNRRADSGSYRYLITLVWCFPFIVGYLYARSGKYLKVLVGAVAVLLVVLNMMNTCMLMKKWTEPRLAEDFLKMQDVRPAIKYLQEKGINRCFATYWHSYRLTYMADENIVCSQPYNERFPGWPLPYKEAVLSSTNVAYVLTKGWRYNPEYFEKDMEWMGVDYKRKLCGEFLVYTDFVKRNQIVYPCIDMSEVKFQPSHGDENSDLLGDGNYVSRWRSNVLQCEGMFVDVVFPERTLIKHIIMYYDNYHADRAKKLKISGKYASREYSLLDGVEERLDPCKFINGKPVYGNQSQKIELRGPVLLDSLRIEIEEPKSERAWTIGEIELYTLP